jgi:hypothetical protein
VIEDHSVLVLDNEAVYSVSSGDASSWEGGDEVEVAKDDDSLTDLSNGEKIDVSRVGDLSESNSYSGTGDELTERSSDGEILVLSPDDSVWAVGPAGQSKTGTWTTSSSITVNEGEGPGNSYRLVNTDEHESVTAHYIGDK